MKSLQTYDPFRDIWGLKDDIDRLFFGFGKKSDGERKTSLAAWAPSVDIMEDKESIKLHVELPGLKKEDVKVSFENGVLTVKGERTFKDEERKNNYHRIERSYGMFERSFSMPNTVMGEKINAQMKDGVLEIMLPKKEEAKPKEIEIEVK